MIAKLPQRPQLRPLLALLVAVAPLPLVAGCAETLRPAADATPAPRGGATATAAGVTIVTMTPEFPGIAEIEAAVTPVRVKITNNSNSTVLVRYDGFTLVSADGTTYPALPLYKIDTTAPTSVPWDPIIGPEIWWNRFRVAPHYRGLYPGIPAYDGPFSSGRYAWPYYDDVFAPDFGRVPLPTPAMYRNVLPEGVLDPGGSLEGWLYFKHVTVQKGAVTFDANVKAADGTSLGELSIPYTFVKGTA